MVGLFESLGIGEILLILAVVLLLFGAKKLPEMARSLGRSSHEFKQGLREGHVEEEAQKRAGEIPPPAAEAAPAPTPAPEPTKAPEKASE
jgi:sec-independent protein translocase protein TatA